MPTKPRDLYTSRLIRNGNSFCAIIPPDLRDRMGVVVGDTLAMNYSHGVLWTVKLTPDMVVNRATVAKIFDELFKGKDGDLAAK